MKIDWNNRGAWLRPENLLREATYDPTKIKGPSCWKLWLQVSFVFFLTVHPLWKWPLAPQAMLRGAAAHVAGGTVATPTYDNDTGSYSVTVSVTISDATGGAAITYCTNVGSDCSPIGGTAYSVPVVITVTATHLCSYATHAGLTASATKCGTYTITGAPLITVVGSAALASASGSSGSNSISYSPTAGNTLLVFIGYFNQFLTPSTVKLSDGTTSCVQDSGGRDDGSPSPLDSLWWYRCTNVPSSITGVTVTQTAGVFVCLAVIELAGLNASPLDATSIPHDVGSSATWSSNLLSPTSGQAELILAGIYEANTLQLFADSPYVMDVQDSTGLTVTVGIAHQIVSSTTGTYTPSGTVATFNASTLGTTYKH